MYLFRDSNLYVSLDYGKSLILRNPKLANGVDEAVCTYIYKSPVNFKKVNSTCERNYVPHFKNLKA